MGAWGAHVEGEMDEVEHEDPKELERQRMKVFKFWMDPEKNKPRQRFADPAAMFAKTP